MKDNEIRELVNSLTDVAGKYRDAQCLRDAISRIVVSALITEQQRITGLEQTLEREREKSRRLMSVKYQQAQRIAELEEAEQKLCAANVSLDARASAAESKLATPVRLPPRRSVNEWYDHVDTVTSPDDDGDYFDRDEVIEALREQGFKVEGDA